MTIKANDAGSKTNSKEGGATNLDRRAALRCLASGALLPLAALPIAAIAQDVPVYPPVPGTFIPFLPRCSGDALANVAFGVTLPVEDPFNDIKALFDIGISLIPEIGGPLGILMDLFWPASTQELSALLLERVQKLVDKAIQATVLDNLANLLGHVAGASGSGQPATGLNGALSNYLDEMQFYAERPDDDNRNTLKNSAFALHQTFTTSAGSFLPASEPFPNWQQQILPYFAQFANLHLTFLRDLVWHGAAIGVDGKPGIGFADDGPGSTMDQFRTMFSTTRQDYVDYASNQLTAIFASLESDYQAKRGVYITDAYALYGNGGYIATGAWNGKKTQNNATSLLIHLVQDYRDLWRVMDDPAGGNIALTRELYFGPYGAPDYQDIGLGSVDGNGNPIGVPDVPAPPPPSDAPLIYVAASTGALITHDGRNFNFPSALVTYRSGDSVVFPPYTGYGIALSEQNGGPVVGVKVDLGRYSAPIFIDDGNKVLNDAAGYLVSKLYFTQKNGFLSTTPGNDDPGFEVQSYEGHVVDVPAGHMLSSVSTPSSVFQLYRYLGKTPTNDTYHSVGSVTFGFKMIDPQLKPSTALLKSLYVTSPAPLSLGDVHQVLLQAYARKGAQLSADDVARFLTEIEDAAKRFLWDQQRSTFWRRIGLAASA